MLRTQTPYRLSPQQLAELADMVHSSWPDGSVRAMVKADAWRDGQSAPALTIYVGDERLGSGNGLAWLAELISRAARQRRRPARKEGR